MSGGFAYLREEVVLYLKREGWIPLITYLSTLGTAQRMNICMYVCMYVDFRSVWLSLRLIEFLVYGR